MYSMKQTCLKTNLPYETLKYYCNEGLIPNVKRDANNYRVFDDDDIDWITAINCLKKCGLVLSELKEYLKLCQIGPSSMEIRIEFLNDKLQRLENQKKEIDDSISFINKKLTYYNDVLAGKVDYKSSLYKKK